jgi:F0F1-type ATP synthase delta subunit
MNQLKDIKPKQEIMTMGNKKVLSPKQNEELLKILNTRFEKKGVLFFVITVSDMSSYTITEQNHIMQREDSAARYCSEFIH